MSDPEEPDSPAVRSPQIQGAPSLARGCFCAKGGKPGTPIGPVACHPQSPNSEAGQEESPSQGPSLTLLFSLVALALAAAVGFALLIVLPFYHRR